MEEEKKKEQDAKPLTYKPKIFTERDGVFYDDKALLDYELAHGEELAEKYNDREERGFKGR